MNGHKIVNQNNLHFLTFTVVGWVDIFTRPIYKELVIESFKFCVSNKGLRVHAYVVMSNHVHVILSAQKGFHLSDIVRDFKRFVANQVIESLIYGRGESRSEWMLRLFKYHSKYNKRNSKFQFWRRDNRPIELPYPSWINQKLNYIHHNPVRAGIVEKPKDYIYSSANFYFEGKGKMEIDRLDFMQEEGFVDL